MTKFTLTYVVDPMCSWCYAFADPLETFSSKYDLPIKLHMGGLAADTEELMPEQQQKTIAAYWRQIEEQTGTKFNHDFWVNCQPRRSTYPSCRAVLAAERLESKGYQMVAAIQRAYYQKSRNPSNYETLIELAVEIGLDGKEFELVVHSDDVKELFLEHLSVSRKLAVSGFPTLLVSKNGLDYYPVTLGYCDAEQLEINWKSAKKKLDQQTD